MKVATDKQYVAQWLANYLSSDNSFSPEICNPHGIKILSTSLSTSRGQSGHQYLRISLLVHPTIHNLLTSTSPRMQGWEIRVQTDTLISKCFTCSKLGHNSPQCANDKSCPFCGNAHPSRNASSSSQTNLLKPTLQTT